MVCWLHWQHCSRSQASESCTQRGEREVVAERSAVRAVPPATCAPFRACSEGPLAGKDSMTKRQRITLSVDVDVEVPSDGWHGLAFPGSAAREADGSYDVDPPISHREVLAQYVEWALIDQLKWRNAVPYVHGAKVTGYGDVWDEPETPNYVV